MATNAIQRRVFSVFWHGTAYYKQADKPEHGIYGILREVDSCWSIVLFEPQEQAQAGLYKTVFKDEPWPASADIILVHQGILDKWRDSGDDVAVAERFVRLKDAVPWIVVTSGRGKPSHIPFGSRFLAFSGLQACLVGDRLDKLLLVRQIEACGGEV